MKLQKYYSTVVLSDIHLGSEHSHTDAVTRFLQQIRCDKLILNGDIIDGWQLKKSRNKWKQEHTGFFKTLMKLMEQYGTEIIYVRGNHDDFLDALVPFTFSNIRIVRDYVHYTHGKKYYVTHGDIFDSITTHMRWLAMMGDWGYTFLLWFNKRYNRWRARKGKTYFSMSQYIKHKVKSAVSYIDDFEKELVRLAESRKYDGVICGHIHQAANTYYGSIHYLNSGDWVESLTALVETEAGEWEIINCVADGINGATEDSSLTTAI
ncbi:MAG: UDP-2,3-diacylglucosamine diphosphatase [Tannerellaceae bacterium]|nr:UDP-2,3-diacylglucosamine diphosphatase [Tannerellaceae bacterium]